MAMNETFNASKRPTAQSMNRRSFFRLAGLVGAAAAGGALVACSSNNSDDSATTSAAAETTAAANSTERVVVLNTGQLDNMLTLGVLPVGSAKAKGADLIPDFIRDEFGDQYDLDSITDCGVRANPNLEVIASLEPTLICANSRTDEAILNQLREIAPVVTGAGGGENWQEDFLTIADAIGQKAKAQELLDEFNADAQAYADSRSTSPTVSFLRTKEDAFQIYGEQSMASTVAAACGLDRPESQTFTDSAGKDISAEQLGEADADWIFYGVQDGATDPATTSVWPTLTGVQNDQAVAVDYEAWYMNASYLSATLILDGLKSHIS